MMTRASVLFLALLAPQLGAQASERLGRFHAGPFWLTPKLVLRNAGVDTNVFNEAGATTSDRQAVLTPSLDAALPLGRRLRLDAGAALGLNHFQREQTERSTDRTFTGRAQLDAGPLSLYALGATGHYKARFSIEIDRRLERSSESFGGGLLLRPARRLTLGGQITRQRLDYQDGVFVRGDSVASALDRESTTTSATLTLVLTPRTDLLLSADVIDDRFTSDPVGPDEARSYRYLAGFGFKAGALLRGSLRAGVRDVPERPDQAAPGTRNLALSVNLGLPLGARAQLALEAARDVNYAVDRARAPTATRRNSYVSGLYGGTLTLELPLSLVARGALTYERADYVLLDGGFDRLDQARVLGVALFRAFGPSLRVGLNAERARRTSNLPGSGYRRTSYGLAAEYIP